ncbi:MAG: cell filamentation protein Fic [Alphaproteobacteria bacterium]|nr:cell filamentation protein Fic [Alphaproteobacteria bacterium]
MNDPLFEGDDEANTPLEAEEREQLIPAYITIRTELNEAEGVNIGEAMRWLARRRKSVLDQSYLEEIHKRMFGDVWRWAGSYRKTARNIGIDAYRIRTELRQVIDDAKHWIEHKTYPPDEIAMRFSHRVVQVHPFPNGNGRFSRQVADMLAIELGQSRFAWGQNAGLDGTALRARYVAALKAADAHDIGPLLVFARS